MQTVWIAIGLTMVAAGIAALHAAQSIKSSASGRSSALVDGSQILLVGDSLGVGLHARLRRLALDEGHSLDAIVQSGVRTRHWLPKLRSVAGRYDLWVIVLGANDAVGDGRSFETDARELCEADPTVEIVWIMPTGRVVLAGWGTVAKAIRSLPVTLVVEACTPDVEHGDRIHPTGAEYVEWADCIWRSMRGE